MRRWKEGDVASAIKLALMSNAKAKKWLGELHPMYAGGLAALGRIYFDSGRYAQAEAELLEYADVELRNFGYTSREYSEALHRLSIISAAIPGREKDAANLQNTAQVILTNLAFRSPDEALQNKLRNLHRNMQLRCAFLHHEAGIHADNNRDDDTAELYYRRSLACMPEDVRETSLNYVTTQLALAHLLSLRGRVVEAEEIGEEAHQRLLCIVGHDDLRVARSAQERADNRKRMGKAEPALEAYAEVVRICDLHADEATSTERMDLKEEALTGMAVLLLEFAHLTQGGAAFVRAVELLRQLDPLVRRHGLQSTQFGMHLAHIARVHRHGGALVSAYALLGLSTRIFRSLGAEAQQFYYTNLLNMGQLELVAGYLADARDHLSASLLWHRKTLGEAHEEVAKCLATLVELAAIEGNCDEFLKLIAELKKSDDALVNQLIPVLPEPDAIRVASQIWWRTEKCLLGAVSLGLRGIETLAPVYALLRSRRGIVLASLIDRARGRGLPRDSSALDSNADFTLVALIEALKSEAALVEYVKIQTDSFDRRTKVHRVPRPKELDLSDLAEGTPMLNFDFGGTVELDSRTDAPGRYLAIVLSPGESGCAELLDIGSAIH
jgi:tetratricopeptide (TPR) repeat protein